MTKRYPLVSLIQTTSNKQTNTQTDKQTNNRTRVKVETNERTEVHGCRKDVVYNILFYFSPENKRIVCVCLFLTYTHHKILLPEERQNRIIVLISFSGCSK